MPIYDNGYTRLLHVHIPRTGGSTITQMFRDSGWTIEYAGQHTVRQYWKDWGDFDYIFTVVRHPVFRALSDARSRVVNPDEVDHWIQNWCKESFSKHCEHNRKQVDFFRQGDGEIFYYNDELHRHFIAGLAGYGSVGHCNYPHIKGAGHVNHPPSLLSAHTLEIVQTHFKEDMEEFNFHWLDRNDL